MMEDNFSVILYQMWHAGQRSEAACENTSMDTGAKIVHSQYHERGYMKLKGGIRALQSSSDL